MKWLKNVCFKRNSSTLLWIEKISPLMNYLLKSKNNSLIGNNLKFLFSANILFWIPGVICKAKHRSSLLLFCSLSLKQKKSF